MRRGSMTSRLAGGDNSDPELSEGQELFGFPL